jgi:anti-sigma factor RsiW
MTASLACREFVDLVTAYLDHALSPDRQAQIDDHLATCEGCRAVLAQWRTVIDLAGRLIDVDSGGAGDESASIRRSELADEWIQRRCKWLH